jgi:hypothetical protein
MVSQNWLHLAADQLTGEKPRFCLGQEEPIICPRSGQLQGGNPFCDWRRSVIAFIRLLGLQRLKICGPTGSTPGINQLKSSEVSLRKL